MSVSVNACGPGRGTLARGTPSIGLPASAPSWVNRAHSRFHVDHARAVLAAACVSA